MNTLASQLIKKFENAEEPNGSEIVLTKIEDLLRLFDTDGDAWAALVEEVADEFEVSIEDFASMVEFARGQDEEGQQELLEIILEIADAEGYDTAKFESKQKSEAQVKPYHTKMMEVNKDQKAGEPLLNKDGDPIKDTTIVQISTKGLVFIKKEGKSTKLTSIDDLTDEVVEVWLSTDSLKYIK